MFRIQRTAIVKTLRTRPTNSLQLVCQPKRPFWHVIPTVVNVAKSLLGVQNSNTNNSTHTDFAGITSGISNAVVSYETKNNEIMAVKAQQEKEIAFKNQKLRDDQKSKELQDRKQTNTTKIDDIEIDETLRFDMNLELFATDISIEMQITDRTTRRAIKKVLRDFVHDSNTDEMKSSDEISKILDSTVAKIRNAIKKGTQKIDLSSTKTDNSCAFIIIGRADIQTYVDGSKFLVLKMQLSFARYHLCDHILKMTVTQENTGIKQDQSQPTKEAKFEESHQTLNTTPLKREIRGISRKELDEIHGILVDRLPF